MQSVHEGTHGLTHSSTEVLKTGTELPQCVLLVPLHQCRSDRQHQSLHCPFKHMPRLMSVYIEKKAVQDIGCPSAAVFQHVPLLTYLGMPVGQ